MNIQPIEIGRLHFDPANANKHSEKNIKAIAASLAKFGQQKVIVVDGDNIVLAGNGTMEAAKSLGWTSIMCHKTELTGPEAIAYAIADNRTSELSEWDKEVLGSHLQGLQEDGMDLADLGFELDDLKELEGIELPEMPDTPEVDPDSVASEFIIAVMCVDERQQEELFTELQDRSINCKLMT